MIIAEVWMVNRSRCGGRFNLYFFWLYIIALPFVPGMFVWDFLRWAERKLEPPKEQA